MRMRILLHRVHIMTSVLTYKLEKHLFQIKLKLKKHKFENL